MSTQIDVEGEGSRAAAAQGSPMKAVLTLLWFVAMASAIVGMANRDYDFAACMIGIAILIDLNPPEVTP